MCYTPVLIQQNLALTVHFSTLLMVLTNSAFWRPRMILILGGKRFLYWNISQYIAMQWSLRCASQTLLKEYIYIIIQNYSKQLFLLLFRTANWSISWVTDTTQETVWWLYHIKWIVPHLKNNFQCFLECNMKGVTFASFFSSFSLTAVIDLCVQPQQQKSSVCAQHQQRTVSH